VVEAIWTVVALRRYLGAGGRTGAAA